MTAAPDTEAGRLTEAVMAAINPFIKELNYNQAWSRVLKVLEDNLHPIKESKELPPVSGETPKWLRDITRRQR